ncbi:MAG: DUF488 domain-containing protein [Planctomycetota bacterium]
MEIHTIGFTKKTAAEFFGSLQRAGIKRLIDVRLNNTSQLAGFAKRDDLKYFLQEICQAEYHHQPLLSPDKDLLDGYKKKTVSWEEYEPRFLALLREREAERLLDRRLFDVPTVLLCSEPTADRCHRRLVAEYLAAKWDNARIVHL